MNPNKKNRLLEIISKAKIRQQLYAIYLLAVFLPILIIGSFLVGNTGQLLTNYYRDLLESDNLRVKTILFEITNQIYTISEEIVFEDSLQNILTTTEGAEIDQNSTDFSYATINNYIYNYAEIDNITIYTDNPIAQKLEYMHFAPITSDIQDSAWYQRATQQSSLFWVPMEYVDRYGNSYWNLCLVRKISIIGSDYNGVLVIRLSDNYLQSRMSSNEYRIEIAADQGQVIYDSARTSYGEAPSVYLDYTDPFYQYTGPVWEDANKLFVTIAGFQLYQSESCLYVVTIHDHAYSDIQRIVLTCVLIMIVALVIPAVLIHYFTGYFTGRVNVLRQEMKKASKEDYDIIPAYGGEDELSEAFADLQVMVQRIQEKDGRMYDAKIKEQQLLNEQQMMEMKMLASQINPHFLYNTLESIRMQALTAGNKEVAQSVKLLGKSMRYVLENTGTASITLQKELDYIETYLMIQKIRFREKVNYELIVEDGLCAEQYLILPLLLQPVIENAIIHGLEEVEHNGNVQVKVSREKHGTEDYLDVVIRDNGCGMDAAELEELRQKIQEKKIDTTNSIGLTNINRRIKLCYGEHYGIEVDSSLGEGTRIVLHLPIKRSDNFTH